MLHIYQVSESVLDSVYEHKSVTSIGYPHLSLGINECAILKSKLNNRSAIVRWRDNQFQLLPDIKSINGISPRDSMQRVALADLMDRDISIVSILGRAGTGKTTLSLAYALDRWFTEGKPIVLSKPAVTVGSSKAFGPVPGDIEDKYRPYLMSYYFAIEHLLGANSKQQLELMRSKNAIRFVPPEMLRGTEFRNCTFILDEAQNMNWHELKTTLSRMHETTKVIVLGDLEQIDIKLNKTSTGLYKLVHAKPYKYSSLSSYVVLERQYRSPLVELLAVIEKSNAK